MNSWALSLCRTAETRQNAKSRKPGKSSDCEISHRDDVLILKSDFKNLKSKVRGESFPAMKLLEKTGKHLWCKIPRTIPEGKRVQKQVHAFEGSLTISLILFNLLNLPGYRANRGRRSRWSRRYQLTSMIPEQCDSSSRIGFEWVLDANRFHVKLMKL